MWSCCGWARDDGEEDSGGDRATSGMSTAVVPVVMILVGDWD